MSKICLEDFVVCYIDAVLETLKDKKDKTIGLGTFYNYVHERVSERIGFSREEVISLHHPFHWSLFLDRQSPLELVSPKKNNEPETYEITIRQGSIPEKSKLVAYILEKYGTLLKKRLEKN